MNLKQLKYVIVLSEECSFSRAADILNISQPSLSQYIKKIEEQVGMPLFERLSGEVKLTDAGRVYIDAGKKILALEHEMESKLIDISNFDGGTIVIGISPYRSVHMMPKVLSNFNKLYPNIKLVIKEKSGTDLIESATHGEFDICIIAMPIDVTLFDYEIIQHEEVVVAVNKSTSLYDILESASEEVDGRKYKAIDIGLIDGQDFAVLDEYMLMRTVSDKLLKMYGINIKEKVEVNSNEALLSIVESGVCASLVPSGIVDGLINTEVFSIKQDFEFRDVAVVWRKDQYLSRPIDDLINIFKSV